VNCVSHAKHRSIAGVIHVSSVSIASYNVLASSYIKAEWYPRTPPAFLDSGWRIPALTKHICSFETDIICLQEIDRPTFAALEASLSARGYATHYAAKAGGQPDGCATFFREATLALRTVEVVRYCDGDNGGESTGHIALVVILQHAGRSLGIANTHLKWDPPTIAHDSHRGLRQIRQLLGQREAVFPRCDGWIVCGDLNATPSSPIVAALQAAGLSYAHASDQMARTCNSNNKAKLIDYLFHTPELAATPIGSPRLDDDTPLPSYKEPSDHLAIMSRFHWVA
jgi:mRNA deadenylase 3'-5' endonuclease subunit Ccr4